MTAPTTLAPAMPYPTGLIGLPGDMHPAWCVRPWTGCTAGHRSDTWHVGDLTVWAEADQAGHDQIHVTGDTDGLLPEQALRLAQILRTLAGPRTGC